MEIRLRLLLIALFVCFIAIVGYIVISHETISGFVSNAKTLNGFTEPVYSNGTTAFHVDYTLVSTTCDITQCVSIFNISYSGTSAPEAIAISNPNNFISNKFTWISGSNRYSNNQSLYGYNQSYNVSVQNGTVYVQGINITEGNITSNSTNLLITTVRTYSNGTTVTNYINIPLSSIWNYKNGTNGWYTLNVSTPTYQNVTQSFINYSSVPWNTLSKDTNYSMEVIGNFQPSLNPISVDFIPTLSLNGVKFTLSELAWWNSSFTKRKEINITNNGETALTSFPAYINVTYDSDMKSNYIDLRFINGSCNSSGTTVLAYEIENYTGINAHIWLGIPNLTIGNSTVCMYYGNSTTVASGQNVTGVWDDNYVAVLHLDETSGTFFDSTRYGNNGTNSGTAYGVAGKVDGAVNKTAAANYIALVNNSNLRPANSVTEEAWVRSYDATTQWEAIGGNPSSTAWTDGYGIFFNSATTVQFYVTSYTGNVSTGTISPVGNWNYVAGTYDKNAGSNQIKIYVNGTNGTSDTNVNPITYRGTIFHIADMGGWTTNWLNGTIDEFRISNISRSANWINQSYKIVANQGSYVFTSGEEAYSTGSSCTYTSGNWNVQCSDNCVISSNVNGDSSNLTLNGTGNFYVNANITGFKMIVKDNNCYVIKSLPNYIWVG